MNGRWGTARPPLWHLVLFGVALLLIGVLAVRQIRRATTTAVWVARLPLSAGAPVRGEDLGHRRLANDSVTPAILLERSQIEGRLLQRPKEEGQPFTSQDFVKPPETVWLSEELPEGRILTTVQLGPDAFPATSLKRGDRLDVVAVDRKGGSRVVGRDAWVMGWINGAIDAAPEPTRNPLALSLLPAQPPGRTRRHAGVVAIILGLHPEDVVPVAQAEAQGERLSFALHSRQEVREGEIRPLPSPSESGAVEVISGAKRERVDLSP